MAAAFPDDYWEEDDKPPTADDDNWLIQKAKSPNMDEKYFPGEFLTPFRENDIFNNATELGSRGMGNLRYSYVPDEMKKYLLKYSIDYDTAAVQLMFDYYAEHFLNDRVRLPIDRVLHTTTEMWLESIEAEKLLRPGVKQFHPQMSVDGLDSLRLVWFTADGSTHRQRVFDHIESSYEYECKRAYADYGIQSAFYEGRLAPDPLHYASSRPFTRRAYRIGFDYITRGLVFKIDHLLRAYSRMLKIEDYSISRLGTMTYSKEVMHALIVHPPKETMSDRRGRFFDQFSSMEDTRGDPHGLFTHTKEEGFVWSPLSTSEDFSVGGRCRYGRWDHASIAFYIPEGCAGFDLEEIRYQSIGLVG